jgi:hypothetical protein
MEGNPSSGLTAANGLTARNSAQDTEAPEFESEQGCPEGTQANPTVVFLSGDGAGIDTHTHTHLHMCMHAPCTRAYT